MIEKVKWHINRDSAEDKLRDLLKWMSAVKADTLHQVSETIYRQYHSVHTYIVLKSPQ